ncbi:MAG: M64 family metallopeptidase [Acidobacteria bacterium]|nr:M64 family metallopeptidase [Acidobacteriota bacterium]
MSARAGLAATLLLLAAGASTASPCPTVHWIVKGQDPKITYNILFLGAGFGEDDLPAFRTVVQELASQLLERPSFAPYSGWINVYRMDLVSSSDVDVGSCPEGCIGGTPLATEIDERVDAVSSNGGSEDTLEIDLVARRCWLSPTSPPKKLGNCNLVWLDAEDRATVLKLQFCAPHIKAVVVVANLRALVGGGEEDPFSAGVGLTVVGYSPGAEDGDSLAGPSAVALLEHEFGHLFGLYDEYVTAAGAPRGEFHADRNVWRPMAPDETQSVLADARHDYERCKRWSLRTGELAPPIPWQATLDAHCKELGLGICEKELGPGREYCVWSPSEDPCEVTEAAEAPGLWEGAYYSEGCFHRAKYSCLMRVASPDDKPCEACQRQIHRALCGLIPGAEKCGAQYVPPAGEQRMEESSPAQ